MTPSGSFPINAIIPPINGCSGNLLRCPTSLCSLLFSRYTYNRKTTKDINDKLKNTLESPIFLIFFKISEESQPDRETYVN